jgi:dihydroxyacetone kinase
VERAWSGTFLSALEMAGASLTLMRVDDQRLARLDAAAITSAWPALSGRVAQVSVKQAPAAPIAASGARLSRESALRRVIEAVCARLLEVEPELTEMDQRVGDGDLGISMSRAAHSILQEIDTYPAESAPADVLRTMSATIRRVVGGTSGPLYAVMLLRAAAALDEAHELDAKVWSKAFTAAVAGVMELGGAQPGNRTMVDALHPAAVALNAALDKGLSAGDALNAAVDAATQGATATAQMHPRLGRSSYVGDRALGFADPGAHAVALWLGAIESTLRG